MNISSFNKNLAWALLAAGLLAAFIPTARATLACGNWQVGSASGNQVFDCNLYTGNTGGTYGNSYQCINKSFAGYCLLDYTGGNICQGSCTIVCKTTGGQTYYCNLGNWDGKETIQCNYLPWGCNEIQIACHNNNSNDLGAVPEPSTMLAGALLLIPLGISVARIMRKHKVIAND